MICRIEYFGKKKNSPTQSMIQYPYCTQEKCINSLCVKKINSQNNKPQNVQSRHENQKMNGSYFSLTKTKQYVPLNPCLCVVCDNILLSKLKTLFHEEIS